MARACTCMASSSTARARRTEAATWVEDPASGLVPGFPAMMVYEPRTRVLYSANAVGGLWALRFAP
jgi:hypothetical protein